MKVEFQTINIIFFGTIGYARANIALKLNTKFDLVSQGENYAAIHTRKRQINTTSSNLLRQIRGLQAVSKPSIPLYP